MTPIDGTTDAQVLRHAYSCFPSGVAVVAADGGTSDDPGPVGMTVSSFTSVSLDPPLVSVCLRHDSSTWAALATRPRLGVSILGADQEWVGRAVAGPGHRRFTGLDISTSSDGAVLVVGAVLWLETSLYDVLPAGDHVIVLLRVLGVDAEPRRSPLVFHASAFHALAPRSA